MTDLAVGLQERGLDMTVFTGQPNYHSGANETQPSHEFYKGVEINRIRAPQLRQSSFIRRGFNWIVFTIWMFFALLLSNAPDNRELVFVSNPPFLPLAMWPVCRLRGWEYTYIVYDLYPDFTVETGYFKRGGVIDRVWSRLSAAVFHDAKHIVALGPAMRDRISRVAGADFDVEKIAIIHNWEDEEFIEPKTKDENWFSKTHGLDEQFTLLYSGNIGDNHDLETVIKAATEFENDTKLLIIGEGDNKDSIVELTDQLGLIGDTVEFMPYQPLDDLPYSLTAGDVSLVSVEESLEGVCVSSKLYTALAAGQPVLLIAQPKSDEARILDTCNAGIRVSQGDSEGVAAALETWKSDPELLAEQGQNARSSFENRFTKDHSLDRYFELLSHEHTLSEESPTLSSTRAE
ncbi:glycosyltransferase family 4 protein [Halococcus qingdaonensis]|uniref:glycosyltransferase family 4 protein n=1 Tax=Halococcus qingdaonensis TaxID=224402 RepID=UPI00211689D4|nr:glycosyltransferase family 4 protein [Halococcus qingdaonensis]